jgi:uncharacterized protein
MRQRTFLTAEWRNLAMINYEIDSEVLTPLVPAGTELETWKGHTYVSLVGFEFLNTSVMGLPIPLHRNFEEVNLRFYVRFTSQNEIRRGVVFIKEIVPRFAIALVARSVYNENYESMHMDHRDDLQNSGRVEYRWFFEDRWNSLSVVKKGELHYPDPGSDEEFITEHYWGYVRERDGRTAEYQVEHPRWRIWRVDKANVDCDCEKLYGSQFLRALSARPSSAFLAEGSPVTVRSKN